MENFLEADFDNPIGDITPFIGNEPFLVVNPLVPGNGVNTGNNGEENENNGDCTVSLACNQGAYFSDQTCSCETLKCVERTGYLHVSNFGEDLSVGENSTTKADNFRDATGAIIEETDCGNGKIPEGAMVNVLDTTPETRDYIKADGTVGQSQYYPVTYNDCEKGNNPGNEDYDKDKPCSDCDHGNPVKDPEIQPQTTDCGVQGGMFGLTRGVNNGCNTQPHFGVDIKNEVNDPIYAMFDGVATLHEQSGGAGFFVKIESQIGGDEIETNYFHLQDDQRVSGVVKAGDIIGYQGTSGNLANGIEEGTTESHVHIKMRKNGSVVDPLPYFKTEFNPDTGEIISSNCN